MILLTPDPLIAVRLSYSATLLFLTPQFWFK